VFSLFYVIQLVMVRQLPLQPPEGYTSAALTSYYFELLAAALVAVGANSLMTVCNKRENPATVSVVGYCGVAYSLIVDTVLFDQHFYLLQLVGMGVTLLFSVGAGVIKIY
jgi:drug/metabolite transporter (DMT)-like permease